MPEIVFVNNISENLHPKHYMALEFAEIYDVDAVYFRYYDDNRYCVPQVYFYDNTQKQRSKEEIVDIHKKVYSSCQVPLICFIDETHITIYDCRKPVVATKQGEITNISCLFKKESLDSLESLNSYFSARHLNYGLFWESKQASKSFLNNQSAYEKLVQVLTDIRNGFIKTFVKNDFPQELADDLLFKCILIKYLEENGKDENNNYARDFYRRSNLKFDTLSEILRNGEIITLLDKLQDHFSGNVFSFEGQENRRLLETFDLSLLAEHLDGKLSNNRQIALWNIYSFKDIPIELISNFYEQFIPKTEENAGTVYTPSFLVNLLIDECLPLSNKWQDKAYNIKLIDVSCGSGIFITSAYKRLVQRWRIQQGVKGKPLDKANIQLKDVKKILSKNIYGVDKNKTAVKLTKFSLQLALCQIVPNNELWNWSEEKVFDDLNDNIFEIDFFDFLPEKKNLHGTFDLVIGNPPFQSINKKNIDIYQSYVDKLKQINFEFKAGVPDRQIALMFLEASAVLLKDGADLCFIQKSTSFLYNQNKKSQQFKKAILNSFYVHQIIDFTLLKNVLFENALVETAAIFYKKEQKDDYIVNHIISRLLKNTKDGLFFEFDYYDFHEVPKAKALDDENIWRCNLLGGSRVNYLIESLGTNNEEKTALKSYLKDHLLIEKERYGEGYSRSSAEGSQSADFITSQPNLIAKNFSSENYRFVNIDSNQRFERPRKRILYQAPLITIKEEISKTKIPLAYHNVDTPFDSRIVGISVPISKEDGLRRLFNVLKKNQRIYSLQTLATCAQFFLGDTSVIQKGDIDKWVIPLNKEDIGLSTEEAIVLNDALDYIYPSWYEGEAAIINTTTADKPVLLNYAGIFCDTINSIYKQDDRELKLKTIYEGSVFYACEFYYSMQSHEYRFINSDIEISALLKQQSGYNSISNRIMRLYANNDTITFVKPKKLKYWLKSIALRDADDTFNDIIGGEN
ncbi:MAG: N-6 DNA methylase [Bacteroidota bacterium]